MTMAASSSLCNILSFLSPSSRSPLSKTPPPNRLSPPLSSNSLPSLSSWSSYFSPSATRRRGGFVSLGLSREDGGLLSSSSSSSSSSTDSDLLAVMYPSLAYANTLFFKSAYNVQVIVDENEPDERLLNRFRREVMKVGVIQECRRRRYFENKQEEKKRKTREAAKRNRRRRFTPRYMPKTSIKEAPKTKKDDDEDDNWELPGDNLPF